VEKGSVPRLDVWLDVACLFRTRAEAQKACKGGKVDVNGLSAKPHREIRLGDTLEISRPNGRRQRVIVEAAAERHIPKAEARRLYRDITPPPSPGEQQMRDLIRLARPKRRTSPAGAPDRRDRRRLRREKEDGQS
jgi:ribosome-associated heat shock protein Hsp15